MENLNNVINLFNKEKIKGVEETGASLAYGLTMVGAGLAIMGAGLASIGQGFAVAKAVEAIGRNPEALSKIRSLLLIGLAIVETASIYSFIVALLLIFV
ncbi:ATP synthase C chain [Metamycoplasma cloacale]|uniref:ATP synthase subunit c n=1 Tax=Metamycoplasma cloacale TaxID=92401 RepID=A0A2Z4LLU2_9BACT|nr:ATP synthase subunit C [Metamycoplasma cloacale]AWX42689.1 F0F1 ATP synthase subunit C [Metamycoplasma cloacale]VEU79499.1 ATP synthase C chain [Metamycoplasma cloacale]